MAQTTNKSKQKALDVAFMGLLFALSVILSFIEGLIPTSFLPPGVKLGLSNILTMYCIFFLGAKRAFALATLKSLFVFLTRGFTASMMSLAGGLFSVLVILLLSKIKKAKLSYLILSVIGAISHNIAQMFMITLIFKNAFTIWYLPILLISGVIMGVITGFILKAVLPALSKLKISITGEKKEEYI